MEGGATAPAWSICGPLAVWLLGEHLRLHPSYETVLQVGLLIATVGIIGTWTVCHFSYFAVTPTQLQIGRSPRRVDARSGALLLPRPNQWSAELRRLPFAQQNGEDA